MLYLFLFLKIMCMHMCLCVGHVHIGAGTLRGQRHQISLKLELQVVMDLLMWVLGMEHSSSARAVCALNGQAILEAPNVIFVLFVPIS